MGQARTPVVLVHGLAGSRRWWSRSVEAIADARLVLLRDTGHVPMEERPDAFTRLTREFLAAV